MIVAKNLIRQQKPEEEYDIAVNNYTLIYDD